METGNESLYRYYRIVSVKKIDRCFYEKHNPHRTHAKIHETVVLPMFGICENTFLDYRNASDELLSLYLQAAYIELSLWFPTVLVRYMPLCEANKFSIWLRNLIENAFLSILRQTPGCRVDAITLITYIQLLMENRMPARAR